MGEVVAIQKPIDKLVLEIRGHVHDAGRAENTCAKHQLQAGARLLELRKRIEAGEAGEVSWWDWYETKFTGYIKTRSYAEKLMRWAQADNPEAAIETERTRVREAVRRHAAKDRPALANADEQNQTVSDRAEYDIVQHALRLVGGMDTEQRERFDEAYRREYQ